MKINIVNNFRSSLSELLLEPQSPGRREELKSPERTDQSEEERSHGHQERRSPDRESGTSPRSVPVSPNDIVQEQASGAPLNLEDEKDLDNETLQVG